MGLSLRALAEAADILPGQLTGYENRGHEPTIQTLVRIARVLDCTTDWLLGVDG